MKTFKILILLIFTLLVSCDVSKKLEFYGETVVVDYPKQMDTLKGNTVTFEGEYTGFMSAYNGILVFESEKHPDGYLYLYDAQTGKRISAIVKIGNGADEYTNPLFSWNFEKDSNETYLWINDHDRNNLVLLNTQGKRVKEISTSKFKSTNPYGIGGFYILNDSLLLAHVSPAVIFEKKYSASGEYVFNYKLGETVKQYLAYSEYEEPETMLYPDYLSSFSVIKPDKTKLATAVFSLKRLNIMDVESGKQVSVATKDAPDLNYMFSDKPVEDYYRTLKCDERYIYVLEYVDGLSPDIVNDSSPGIVNVFDWDGNFVRILRIDEGYVAFAFDPIRKILYTKNDAEKVMAYDVNYLYK